MADDEVAMETKGPLHDLPGDDDRGRVPGVPGRVAAEYGGGKVFLIVDRLRAHKTPEVERWLARHRQRIEVFYLPRYAPELNADGYLNNDLKGQVNAAGVPQDKQEVRSRIQAFMRKLLHLPKHVMSYFQHPAVRPSGETSTI
jgi:hypothetical protein